MRPRNYHNHQPHSGEAAGVIACIGVDRRPVGLYRKSNCKIRTAEDHCWSASCLATLLVADVDDCNCNHNHHTHNNNGRCRFCSRASRRSLWRCCHG